MANLYGCHSTRRPDPRPGARLPGWAAQEPACYWPTSKAGKDDPACRGCADKQRALGIEGGGDG